MEALICVLVVPAALFVWTLISPQSVWRRTAAWQYRKPEVNEPSDAAYTMHRVLSFAGLVVVVVLAVILLSASNQLEGQQEQREQEQQREQQEEEYEDCLIRHNDDDNSIISAEEWCDGLSPEPAQP